MDQMAQLGQGTKQTGPFISLAQVPSIIRAIINNEEPKIGANTVLAESFGIAPYHTIDTTRLSYEKSTKTTHAWSKDLHKARHSNIQYRLRRIRGSKW